MPFKKQMPAKSGCFFLLSLLHSNLMANDKADLSGLWDLSLAELLALRMTSVASNSLTPINEQPAVVSIITAREIHQAGAHDLIDVLRLVPGFEFQSDVYSVIGVSFRGIWAHEGRILLMIDDMECTDMLFGTLAFGQHYGVDQIEKIEIIRGPGGAKYGGNVQLAVIKITTKGEDLNGVETIINSGNMGGHSAFNSVTVNSARQLEKGYIKASVVASSSPQSAQTYIDFYGSEFDQGKDSSRESQN